MGLGIPLNLPWARLYTVTGMHVAANFVTGIWVVAVAVATVGVGSAGGIGFRGKVGLVGICWVITLTLSPRFTGTLALLFFSAFWGLGTFLCEEFVLGEDILVHDWLPSLPSSSKYVVYQGLQDMTCMALSPEHVDPCHCFKFHFNIHHFYWQKAPEVLIQEVAF